MNKAHYELDQQTKDYIFELIRTCKNMGLGNVNFKYFPTRERGYEVFFYMLELMSKWELVVKHECNRMVYTDVYKIIDDTIEIDYSEEDCA